VTVIDRIPALKGHGRRRAIDEVDRLNTLLAGANALLRGLQLQVADRDALLADSRAKAAEAE
jgi:hypothetical protein